LFHVQKRIKIIFDYASSRNRLFINRGYDFEQNCINFDSYFFFKLLFHIVYTKFLNVPYDGTVQWRVPRARTWNASLPSVSFMYRLWNTCTKFVNHVVSCFN